MLQPDDTFDLDRFLEAQEDMYAAIKSELSNGRKLGHWMWFTFPQVEGLGSSYFSKKYAIRSAGEARSYLRHSILGARLIDLTDIVTAHTHLGAGEIFGSTDAKKFRSSMTLFCEVSDIADVFQNALDAFFSGKADEFTLKWLSRQD